GGLLHLAPRCALPVASARMLTIAAGQVLWQSGVTSSGADDPSRGTEVEKCLWVTRQVSPGLQGWFGRRVRLSHSAVQTHATQGLAHSAVFQGLPPGAPLKVLLVPRIEHLFHGSSTVIRPWLR